MTTIGNDGESTRGLETVDVGAVTASGGDAGALAASLVAMRKAPSTDSGVSLPRISLGFPEDDEQEIVREASASGTDLALLSLIGEGGMGAVYLARQRSLRREVAVKCLRSHQGSAAQVLLHEARVAGSLEHPNIVPVHALGRDEQGGPVIVMKRVEGTPWRALVDREDHPAWKQLDEQHGDRRVAHLQVLSQVCNALAFAHSRGVIHRDIKPDNVMIGGFGEVYLLDWGVAIRRSDELARDADGTPSVRIVGTPNYMAPEMVSGDERDADARTDVYLLGATLHEVLTGTYRHDGANVSELLLAASLSEPAKYRADVPEELAALCNAATHKDPDKRPQTVLEFRHAIDVYLAHRGSVALTRTADAALDRFRTMLENGESRDVATRSDEAHRHLTEARFGYMQALREWAGNTVARAALDDCLAQMVEREIVLRSPDAALALWREMASPPAALKPRVDALAAEINAQRARDEQARREALEQDSSVSSRVRVVAMLGALGAGIFMSIDSTRSEMRSGRPIPMSEALEIDMVSIALLIVGMVLARKKLFANRISRQLTWLAVMAVGLGTASDVLVTVEHGNSRTAGLHAMMVYGTTVGVGALLLLPGLWIASVMLFVGAAIAAWKPVLTSGIVTLATFGTLLSVIHQILEHGKRSPDTNRLMDRQP